MIAAVGDTPYRIVLVLHILAAIAAFAPVIAHPLMMNRSKSFGPEGHRRVMGLIAGNGRSIHGPALIATGILGFALQGMSGGAWTFGQFWMLAAIVVWVAMNGVLHALVLPSERKMADGDESAQRLAELGGVLMTIMLIIMVWLMVFQPGA